MDERDDVVVGYAAAVMVINKTTLGIRSTPRWVSGVSDKDEAIEVALREAKDIFPTSEGWVNHGVAVLPIYQSQILGGKSKERSKEKVKGQWHG